MDESTVEAKKLSPTLTPKPSEAELKPSPPPSTPVAAMPTPPAEPISAPQPKVSKKFTSMVLVCLLIVAGFLIFASTVKCMPVVRSYTVDETRLQWKEVNEEIFSQVVSLSAYSTYSTSGWSRTSPSFYMEKYWQIRVEGSSGTANGWLYIDIGTRQIASTMSPGLFVTPQSGNYYVSFSNFGSSPATVSMKITVTAKLESVTVQVTKQEVIYLTIIEWLTKKS
jgi:hypothetical protein